MKDYSVAQIKKGFKRPIHQLPREGSRIRGLYDLFSMYKGHIIDLGPALPKNHYMTIQQLVDFYGMDIHHIGKGKFCFSGEYIGSRYVSYDEQHRLMIKPKGKKDV